MSTKQTSKDITDVNSKKENKQTSVVKKENPDTKSMDTEADKKLRKQRKLEQRKEKRENRKPRRRIFPIWLRLIIVVFLCFLALVIGLMIGYGVLGDGNKIDALKIDTWRYIIDFVKKE